MVVIQLSFILCGFLIPTGFAKEYWYVVAPNVFRLNHEETLVTGVLGNGRGYFQIKLFLDDVQIAQKQAIVMSQENSNVVTMKVTAENVMGYLEAGTKKEQKPTHVTMVAYFPDGSQSTREIPIGYTSGYLIVQTDKPLYTPMEAVSVRVLAMDESLKPIRDQNVSLDFRTPSSDIAGDAGVKTVDRRTFKGSMNGFFRHRFMIPPYPQIGEWTIKAYLAGQYDTETIVPFEVKEFVLPTFGVNITSADEYILENTEEIKVRVEATYVYGEKVQGSAGLQFSIVEDNGAKNEVFTETRNDLINGLTEFTINVRDLQNARRRGFPENAHLLLESDVIEDATGKEEKSSEDFLVFTKSPFRFDLSRSKNTYRPGISYYLKGDMIYVNGRKADNQRIKIRLFEGNEERRMVRDEYITNDIGQFLVHVSTATQQQQLLFQVHSIDYPGETVDFHVKPYIGNNQMVVDIVDRDNAPFIRAYTNMYPFSQFTGIMMMIVSRGEIVYTSFSQPTNEINIRMENHILKKVSPGARLLAFYVDKHGDGIVADSTKFAVDPMCKGEPLRLTTRKTMEYPGAIGTLMVTGPSDMWVGLNIIDKALLLRNRDNVIKHDTIFQALDSHDLGCGDGSGQNSEAIFKNTGLTILTNANVDQAALTRTSEHCDKVKMRRRRSVSSLNHGLERRSILTDDDQYKTDENTFLELLGVTPRERSNVETSYFFEEHQLNDGYLEKRIRNRDSITEWSVQAIGISATEGACIAESVDVKTYQPFFIHLDLPYKATRFERLNIKATVFNYYDQTQTVSVYLKGVHGLCYGTSPGKNSPRTLFELKPNSAHIVSFSAMPLVAGDITVTVSAFVTSDSSAKADVIEKKLHVVNEGIMETTQIHVCLDPNNQMEACRNSPQVTAYDPLHGDISVRIYVIDLALPGRALTGTGSASAYIETEGHYKQLQLLHDVAKLFNEPSGSGEQTMMRTAPIVYGMNYLRKTGLETAENEVQGTRWIRQGILRESSVYQKGDGSYAAWRSHPTSLWLTAFVAKVFCQVEKMVDGVVDKGSLSRTLQYIVGNQKGSGYFVDDNPVRNTGMQGVFGRGQQKEDPSLTSFVLIALQECPQSNEEVDQAVSNAIDYLEALPLGNLQNNKYMLAITTYALALSNSKQKGKLKDLLLTAATETDDMMFWSDHSGNEATGADVETTAYALLAFLKFNDIRTSGKIGTWLTGQWKSIGVWDTTQDTVVALQALAEYSVRTYNREVNLEIEIQNGRAIRRVSVTNENAFLQRVIPELLTKGESNNFKVTVSGTGTAIMNIELRWNRKALPNEKCYFDISPIKIDIVNPAFSGYSQERPCDVCGRCPGDYIDNIDDGIEYYDIDDVIHNRRKKREAVGETPQKCVTFDVKTVDGDKSRMAIVKVNLETDVKAIEDDFKELITIGVIDRYEMPQDGKSFVIFYINEISQVPRKFIFRLEDHFQGSTAFRQPATVVVYDYYKPEKTCIVSYGIGDTDGHEIAFRCDENNDLCECLQSQCSSPVDEELFDYTVKFSKLPRDKKAQTTKPTAMIANYACNLDKANFVYKVTIEKTYLDEAIAMRCASAVIDSVILAGNVPQDPGDKIALEWKWMCRHPYLKWGKTYYIVGKDPIIFKGYGNVTKPRYELMGTTLVIDPSYNPMLRTVMDRFEKQMKKNNGCFH
ncbi:complement C3-like isoform X2 [Mya arenaria]|uniref:complement C3-like isoform X2 n=1 Tax=Mya arenaria TaxID=6604 RepID=UPI0022E301F4|nr:complement C3-like isoform X2 [Mya arenaria]